MYKGYQGEIKENPNKEGHYIVKGKYHWSEEQPNKVIITEIPIKKWTEDYKYFLQELMGIEIISRDNDDKSKKKGKKKKGEKKEDEEEKKKKKKEIIIEDLRENHTYNRVCFEVTLLENYAKKFKDDEELFLKTFNLTTSINIKNMVLFSPAGKLKKYNSIEEILETFYNLRLKYYHTRKEYMISALKKEVAILSNKARFIKMVIEDELIIKKKKRVILVNELYDLKFDTQSMLNKIKMKTKEEINAEIEFQNNNDDNADNLNNNNEEDSGEEQEGNKKIKLKVPVKEYDYLLNMNLWSLTHEKIEELLKQKEQKEKELDILEKTEIETLWDNDLNSFEEELIKYEKKEEEDRLIAQKLNKAKSGVAQRRRRGGGRKKKGETSDTSSVNEGKSENDDSNNTSIMTDITGDITKKRKGKKKVQTSLNDFINSGSKEKTEKKDKSKSKNKDKSKSKKKKRKENESLSKSVSDISESENKNSNIESSVDYTSNENSFFKMPLKERLKQRSINIGESPLPYEAFSYGPNAKRDGNDDLSDLDFSFDDKEKAQF